MHGACTSDGATRAARAPTEGGIADPGFLDQFARTNRFRQGKPAAITITPDGREVLFLRSGGRDRVQNLYAFDVATGQERTLLTAERLLAGDEEELTAEELARRERMRVSARGIASFTLSKDGARLLVPLSGRLFVVERATGGVRELPSDNGAAIDARFSPDGAGVACVREGDLYVIEVASGAERRLTTRESEHVTNGLAEFVAQEEMGRMEGYWWSPDSAHIAYTRVDTEGLEVFNIMDPFDPAKEPQRWPYPRAGTKNAHVRLGVMSAAGGETTWVEWDDEAFPYLATVRWSEHAPLTILVQDRAQQEQRLLAVDVASGSTTTLLVERDEAWLNLDQDMPRWLASGEAFLWSSEREGEWRLELRARDGSLVRRVTPRGMGYRSGVLSVDEERGVAYVLGGDEPTERHVYRVSLEGGSAQRLSAERGLHSARFSNDHEVVVHVRDVLDGGESWPVRGRDGARLGELASVAERPNFRVGVELTTTTGHAEAPRAAIVRPRNFEPGATYPVILSVYGGPGVQMATASATGRSAILNQWIADHGFVVVCIDGRGTPARGRAWERALRGDYIEAPLRDQTRGLRDLAARHTELDLSRVGVYGWSYGGYFSAMAVMREPGLFKAGFAGAPVCDWIDYDTHYTERYIGLPQEDPAAYERSNVLTYAPRLERPLLIAHGTADDNVYFVHALKMSDALLKAGIAHDFLPLAGQTHMVTDPAFVVPMHERMMEFFIRHVRGE